MAARDREKFLEKHRSKMIQPVAMINDKPMLPLAFDKINNHATNYNLYPLEDGIESFVTHQNMSPLPHSIKNQPSKITLIQNRALNRTVEPHYHHELSPPEHERSVAADLTSLNVLNALKPSDSNRLNNNYLTEKPSVGGGLNWKPSTDRIINENENLKSKITKLEYQKMLDQQVLEKQLQKAYEQKVNEMEDMILQLRFERDKLAQEKNEGAPTSNRKPGHRLFDQSSSLSPRDRNVTISYTNNHSRKTLHGGGGGSGAGAPIFIQPGDSNLKSIRSSRNYHNSSKKIIFEDVLLSHRDPQDRTAHLDDLV